MYTGEFNECRNVLISNKIKKHRKGITTIYLDNTMASVQSLEMVNNRRTCENIMRLIE